ncbi:MAG TPA: hypothetical protein PLA50_00655, partial [Bacteroidia bacterium]|nr:hypothetical protein [Bacteroidia bacterium]
GMGFGVASGEPAAEAPAKESVDVRELRMALDAERGRAEQAEAQRRALVESLAEAVRVSEEQMATARDTELKLQALGVDLVVGDANSLEQRLLKAVRDLDIAQQDLERQRSVLHRLSESFLKVVKATPGMDAKLKAEAERSIASADQVLAASSAGGASAAASDLSSAKVVSIDDGIGLVVFDAGRSSGLRIGTPVTVVRGDRPLYSALIVDVRDSISGAVLQDRMANADAVEVGDGIRLLPEQNPL